MLISFVIPVYNGALTIGRLVEKLISLFPDKKLQIVLVNDGSADNSHDVCNKIYSQYPAIIKYLNLSKNFGEHNAVMAGLNHVDGDYAVIMDDDFQNPPEEVIKLIDQAKNSDHDVVYTYYKHKKHNIFRNLGSSFNGWVANFMLKKPKDLYLSSFKCINRFLIDEIIKYNGPFPYIDGLILRATKKIGKIEVKHCSREEGRSGYTFRKLISLWLNMFVNFSIMPLRVSSLLGIIMCFLGIILAAVVVIDKLIHPELPIGWSSLMVGAMVFSGTQLLLLGIFGEYLGRLFLSNNQTPQFIVRDIKKLDVQQ